jgi:hypothetical protein
VAVAVEALEREVEQLRRRAATMWRAAPDDRRRFNRDVAEFRKRAADHFVERQAENRPEVITRGKPFLGDLAQRGQVEARYRLERTQGFKLACSDCPAAQTSREVGGGVRVECRVEGTTLSSRTDPQSLLTFCMGDHQSCPSWVMDRELSG